MNDNELWEYNPGTDQWTLKTSPPGAIRRNAIGFALMGKGYLACGINQQDQLAYLKDIWVYDPSNDGWTAYEKDYP